LTPYRGVFTDAGGKLTWLPGQVLLAVDSLYRPSPSPGDVSQRGQPATVFPSRRSGADFRDPGQSVYLSGAAPSRAPYDSLLGALAAAAESENVALVISLGRTLPRRDLGLDEELYTWVCQILSHAGLASVSRAGFGTELDSLLALQERSLKQRFLLGLDILVYGLDPQIQQRDALLSRITLLSALNDSVFSATEALRDSLSLPDSLPALAVVSAPGSRHRLHPGERLVIAATVRNLSQRPLIRASVLLAATPSLFLLSPAARELGTLEAGGETTVEWTLEARGATSSMGAWVVRAAAENAWNADNIGFVWIPSGSTPPTGCKLDSRHVYCYKNPFNPAVEQTHVRFSLPRTDRATIEVRDGGGLLVRRLASDRLYDGGVEQEIAWDGRNAKGTTVANGLYFVVIEAAGGERAVAKVSVLR
jgi:hypothetical protein